MKIKRKQSDGIFDRAYDKAARLGPGDPSPLARLETRTLRRYLHRMYVAKRRAKKKSLDFRCSCEG